MIVEFTIGLSCTADTKQRHQRLSPEANERMTRQFMYVIGVLVNSRVGFSLNAGNCVALDNDNVVLAHKGTITL